MSLPEDEVKAPVLFLFAHHDDEIFIATLIRRLTDEHGQVACAWLTRGGLGGREREAESPRAVETLGVGRNSLFFFRLPDGKALDYLDEIVNRLTRLLVKLRIVSVFVPAFEGGHPDHDTAQLALALSIRLLPGGISLYEFPLYNRYHTRLFRVGEFIPDTASTTRWTSMKLRDRLLKRKLSHFFASQRLILVPLLGLKGGPMMLHLKGEPFRRVPVGRDYRRRPHAGRLAYEYFTRYRFGQFAEKVRR